MMSRGLFMAFALAASTAWARSQSPQWPGPGCDGSARAGVRQTGGNCRQCGAEQAGKHSRSGNTVTWWWSALEEHNHSDIKTRNCKYVTQISQSPNSKFQLSVHPSPESPTIKSEGDSPNFDFGCPCIMHWIHGLSIETLFKLLCSESQLNV